MAEKRAETTGWRCCAWCCAVGTPAGRRRIFGLELPRAERAGGLTLAQRIGLAPSLPAMARCGPLLLEARPVVAA